MNILVTGGAGFIGSHIAKLLCDRDHQVTVIDNLSSGHEEAIDKRAKFIKGDLAGGDQVKQALQDQDAVIHMAAFIEVADSVKKPVEFFKNNVENSFLLLEMMKQAGVNKIIFSSTAAVYQPQNHPLDENDPKNPENPYGGSKLAFEAYLSAYHKCFNIDFVSLRYFNVYGPGERHDPETHAIPNFIKAVLNDQPIPLYWQGEQIRDFIYVDDIANAHIRALELSGCHYLNVGTGQGTKVMDLVNKICKIVGKKPKIDDLGERKGDVQILVAKADKIKKILGWEPQVGLEEGLRRTIEWFEPRQG